MREKKMDAVSLGVIGFIISVFIGWRVTPYIIRSSLERGITTVDAHKPGKPVIPEPGGIVILMAFIFALLFEVLVMTFETPNFEVPDALLAGLLAITIAGLIGFFDDVFRMRWRAKILLGFLPALPLMALRIGKTTVAIPLVGVVDFGMIYPLLLVPLAVNFAFNSFNMVAGFNGLEVGNASISLIFILIAGVLVSSDEVIIMSSCLLGASLILLYYNWYPAKTLIGDTGTLTLGTALIVILIVGNMERLALGVFFLHFLNFLLFFVYVMKGNREKLSKIDENEGLVPPCPWTVYWILPYFVKGVRERTNVLIILGIHTFFSIIGLAIFLVFI